MFFAGSTAAPYGVRENVMLTLFRFDGRTVQVNCIAVEQSVPVSVTLGEVRYTDSALVDARRKIPTTGYGVGVTFFGVGDGVGVLVGVATIVGRFGSGVGEGVGVGVDVGKTRSTPEYVASRIHWNVVDPVSGFTMVRELLVNPSELQSDVISCAFWIILVIVVIIKSPFCFTSFESSFRVLTRMVVMNT